MHPLYSSQCIPPLPSHLRRASALFPGSRLRSGSLRNLTTGTVHFSGAAMEYSMRTKHFRVAVWVDMNHPKPRDDAHWGEFRWCVAVVRGGGGG